MIARRFDNKMLVRIDKGEEIVESLTRVCRDNEISLGSVLGIGATNRVKIGIFDVDSKEYHSDELVGNYEISPLSGNISTMNGKIYLHLHINLCDSKHNSFGGHLNHAIVSATFECIIDIIDGKADRVFDEETGLNLLKI